MFPLLFTAAASMEADGMEIHFKTSGMLMLQISFNYNSLLKIFLNCSLKQPPWRLGAMQSPNKTSGILMQNKILIAIYYCMLFDWFLNFSLKLPP